MDKQERLIDQLKENLSKLDDKQKDAFRQSLKRQLPGVIKKATEDAKNEIKKDEGEQS